MITVHYAPTFVRMYKGLDQNLKEEVKDKLSLFKEERNHPKLKVHKLKGRLENTYSFSVNFKIRIIFEYGKNKKIANMLYVGSHEEVYE